MPPRVPRDGPRVSVEALRLQEPPGNPNEGRVLDENMLIGEMLSGVTERTLSAERWQSSGGHSRGPMTISPAEILSARVK